MSQILYYQNQCIKANKYICPPNAWTAGSPISRADVRAEADRCDAEEVSVRWPPLAGR